MVERGEGTELEKYVAGVRRENAEMHDVRISFLMTKLKEVCPQINVLVLNRLHKGMMERIFKKPRTEIEMWRFFLAQGWAGEALQDVANWLNLVGDFSDYQKVRTLKLMRLRDWVYYKGPDLVLPFGMSRFFGMAERKMAEANDVHIKARARELSAEYIMTDMRLTNGAAMLLCLPLTLGLVEAMGVAVDTTFNIGAEIDELEARKEAVVTGGRQVTDRMALLHGSVMAADVHQSGDSLSVGALANNVDNFLFAAKGARALKPEMALVATGSHDLDRRMRELKKLEKEFYKLAVNIAEDRLPNVIKQITMVLR